MKLGAALRLPPALAATPVKTLVAAISLVGITTAATVSVILIGSNAAVSPPSHPPVAGSNFGSPTQPGGSPLIVVPKQRKPGATGAPTPSVNPTPSVASSTASTTPSPGSIPSTPSTPPTSNPTGPGTLPKAPVKSKPVTVTVNIPVLVVVPPPAFVPPVVPPPAVVPPTVTPPPVVPPVVVPPVVKPPKPPKPPKPSRPPCTDHDGHKPPGSGHDDGLGDGKNGGDKDPKPKSADGGSQGSGHPYPHPTPPPCSHPTHHGH